MLNLHSIARRVYRISGINLRDDKTARQQDDNVSVSIGRLITQIDDSINLPTKDFLALVDREKRHFHEHSLTSREEFSTKLHLIKLLNLLVNKHEYLKNKVKKVGRPSGFMLDPANACQLGCPTCQHSFNKKYTSETYVQMPKGIMKKDSFAKFIEAIGPYAYVGHFYNNSEPFLNKHICDYLSAANLYRINTLISSNLSLPNLDAEAIVESGLNTLMAAIDGTTQENYQKYRRGGNLELVFDNVAKIAAAKKRLKRSAPRLRWQFLTFQHNVHEVEDAIALAKNIGFDSFNVATPYDVSGDEPSIQVAVHPRIAGGNPDIVFTPDSPIQWLKPLEPIAEEIDKVLSESLLGRYETLISTGNPAGSEQSKYGHCDWLHLGIIFDALGRILPCCIPDYQGHGSFVFGNLDNDYQDLYNSAKYQQARLLFADRDAYKALLVSEDRANKSKCDGCHNRPLPQIGLGAVSYYLQTPTTDSYGTWFGQEHLGRLIGWSRHTAKYDPALVS